MRQLVHILLALLVSAGAIRAQDLSVFGQNRVQYKEFKWRYYQTEHFDIYFAKGGREISRFVIDRAEAELAALSERIDHSLPGVIQIVVYNDLSDLNQTNIGVKRDDYDMSGQVKILDRVLFVYFDGDHAHLEEQLRKGITRLMIEKMMAGSGFQESIQNALLLNLPAWFTDGLIDYLGEGWQARHDAHLRENMLRGDYRDLSKLSDDEMTFVSHALWAWIDREYGANALSNLLYLVRVNRSMDSGFNYVLGGDVAETLELWYYAHLERYKTERDLATLYGEENAVDGIRLRRDKVFHSATISPDARRIALVDDELGRYRVLVYDRTEETQQVVHRGGFKTLTQANDRQKPILAWTPDGRTLSILEVRRDELRMVHVSMEDGKKEVVDVRGFQNIFGFSYKDPRTLILSAMRTGRVDLYEYDVRSGRSDQLTDDVADDLAPVYMEVDGLRGVLFSSNRTGDTLVSGDLDSIHATPTRDLFFLPMPNPTGTLVRVTNTPLVDETTGHPLSDSTFVFLSPMTGIATVYHARFERDLVRQDIRYVYRSGSEQDSVVVRSEVPADSVLSSDDSLVATRSVPVSAYVTRQQAISNGLESIDDISTAPQTGEFLTARYNGRRSNFFVLDIDDSATRAFSSTWMQSQLARDRIARRDTTTAMIGLEDAPLKDTVPARPTRIVYQSPFMDLDTTAPDHLDRILARPDDASSAEDDGYRLSRTRQYFLKFRVEDVGFGLDNNLLITPYQPFNPSQPVFQQPNLNSMIRFGITDIFENHKIHGGFRVPFDFSTTEIYLTYENLTKRLDKSFTYYRRAANTEENLVAEGAPEPIAGTVSRRTNIVMAELSYPFDVLTSVRFTGAVRNDRRIVKSTDQATLNTPNQSQNWVQTRFDLVHDNTVEKTLNIRHGLRFNAYVEAWKEIPTRADTLFGESVVPLPQWNDAFILNIGADLRHYQKIHKDIIWANRFAFASSMGTSRMIYYLGGQSNPWFPGFNRNTPVNTDQNRYVFQTIATPLRGFQQNIRNGNSFAVFNSELRVPIVSTFSRSTVRSEFLRHLQLVAFVDVGTAWEGPNPFQDEDEFDRTVQNSPQQPTAIARLDLYKRPIVAGYGFGVRAFFLQYFIRGDLGWGSDTGERSGPRFQMAVGLDF